MRAITIIFLVLFPSFLYAVVANAADRTVCSSGCNYTTIASAYSAASCGDTITINDSGTYNECQLVLNKNCTNGNELTIQAGDGHSPQFSCPSQGSWVDAIILSGDYHIWDGINLIDCVRGSSLKLAGNNNTIQNITLDGAGSYYWPAGENAAGIWIQGDSNIIQNNTFLDSDHDDIQLDGINGDPDYNQILNNTFNNQYGHGIEILEGTSTYNLIDGNTFTDCGSLCSGGSGCASKNAIEISGGQYNSIRRNVIYDIYRRAFEIDAYSSITNPTNDNWVYNNTLYNIGTAGNWSESYTIKIGTGGGGTYTVTNNIFKNNIIAKVGLGTNSEWSNNHMVWVLYYATPTDAGDNLTQLTSNDWNGNYLVNNIIRPYYSGAYQLSHAHAVRYTNSELNYQPNWSVTDVNGVGSMDGNITSDPWQGVEPNTGDANWWYITAGSPAIDAGVVVNDPNAATGGWSQLTYSGPAPDIGAYEYGSTDPTITGIVIGLRIAE